VDAEELRRLAPDLILTQGLCEVCAVSDGEVYRLTDAMRPAPRVLSLTAHDLQSILADILNVAEALDLKPEGDELVAGLRYRLNRLVESAPAQRPRIVVVEWLDPLYLAGHWVPELVAAAGGIDVGAAPGAASRRIDPGELATLAPEPVLVALCGFSAERARAELERTPLPPLAAPVWVLDGNAYTSRAGPRVVDAAALVRAAVNDEVRPGVEKLEIGVRKLGSDPLREIGVRPP
jgi:iron complex transport system substrate-binding protein